jgi:hypothetical protein
LLLCPDESSLRWMSITLGTYFLLFPPDSVAVSAYSLHPLYLSAKQRRCQFS